MLNALFVVALIVVPACLGADCGLSVWVADEVGLPIPYRIESFIDVTTKVDRAGAFVSLRAEKISCGEYNYVVTRADFNNERSRISGRLRLKERHQWLTLRTDPSLLVSKEGTIAVDSTPPAQCEVRGHLSNFDSQTPVWVRLTDVNSGANAEAEVVDGSFGFRGVCKGRFLVVVLAPRGVLVVEEIEIQSASLPVTFDLDLRDTHWHFKLVK